MATRTRRAPVSDAPGADYRLADQVGFLLRQANQRHTGIFAALIGADLTPTRFAALAKLYEDGALPQNELGRRTAMDAATIKGVVDRLRRRGLASVRRDPQDARKHLVELTGPGRHLIEAVIPAALEISRQTLKPLSAEEASTFVRLLRKLT